MILSIILIISFMQYDTRCYFNVCSKVDTSQLDLPQPHARSKELIKVGKRKKVKMDNARQSGESVESVLTATLGRVCGNEGFKPAVKE